MEQDKIDIAKHLSRLEDTGCPVDNIVAISMQVAQEIKHILVKKEKLRTKEDQFPILETFPTRSTEIWMWAIAILSSAWTQWCFTAKSNNPDYSNAKPEASENARIALPYLNLSIIDATRVGDEIGKRKTDDPNTTYRPESGSAWIELRRE
jgi:hypothetical protein